MIAVALIVDGPVTPEVERSAIRGCKVHAPILGDGAIGATLRFEGIVRRIEADPARENARRDLAALDYQTYDPMAQQQLSLLANDVAERHGLKALITVHSRGRVAVGEVSFVLSVWSAHRAEAIAALTDFIDRLKQDVPIWKSAVWLD